ncbi:YHS domain-containing (seleno)protein [Hansschlegelia quercus]|uniref:YHS domain-containing (seleno)protein n=1 Tax=Hansschlegelia quercus TaxID=2528245 RepID=UPI001FE0FE73|nr:YHS domain-containing (seleno)protein [Hansschlegelia quercus]
MESTRLIAPLLAALAFGCGSAVAVPGLTEKVVSDPSSGIALYGYDPVAYFVDSKATPGRRDIEAEWNGAAWRFESEANRAAFLSAPDVYAPRFGGYDPEAVANGAAAAGHPLLFRVSGDRLYLFRTSEARDSFANDAAAEAAWPKLEAKLTD